MATKVFTFQARALDGLTNESGALTYVVRKGTTTPIIAYTDSGLTTPATNPQVANALGLVGPLYWNDSVEAEVTFRVKTNDAATVLLQVDYAGGAFSASYIQVGQLTKFNATYTADGAQTKALTGKVVSSPYGLNVYFDGIIQPKDNYTVTTDGTDSTITWATSCQPTSGVTVYYEAAVLQALSPAATDYSVIDISAAKVTPTAATEDSLANWLAAKVTASGGDASATVVTPTGGTTARSLAARFGETVNVKDYGATGDGATDDTSAISAAITAAGVGGEVYFPEGVYIFSSVLTQLSGQRWFGAGRAASILRLKSTVTSITVAITASNFATDYSIENLQVDGNRGNITPSSDLFSTFYLIRGPRGGERGSYKNLLLTNSWGRSLQTSDESQSEYAVDITVHNVWVTNAGTKAISATQSKRVTISDCFAEVDAYTAAQNTGGGTAAASGSCFECNDAHDVTIKGCHGVQIATSQTAPGIRFVNASSSIKAFGNTIDGAEYLGFIQNCDDVEFYGNTGRNLTGNAILIADSDDTQPTATCKRIRVHHNKVIDCDDAYVIIQANKNGYNAYVEAYIYENDFVQVSGSPTYGIYNNGVASPAIGGQCLVYEWGNRYTGTIPNQRSGPAAHEIQTEPDSGWQILSQSSVAVSHTGTTAETTLATITVPANRMGKNGRVRITAHFSYPNSADDKITRIRFGGSQLGAYTNTTTVQQRTQIEMCNQNSLSAQIVSIPGLAGSFGTTTTALLTRAADTSTDKDITLTVQLETAAETVVLQSYLVELFYQI